MKKTIDTLVLKYTVELLERYETRLNVAKYDTEQKIKEKALNDLDGLDYKIKLLDIDIYEVQSVLKILKDIQNNWKY